jgi:hypothetical protein
MVTKLEKYSAFVSKLGNADKIFRSASYLLLLLASSSNTNSKNSQMRSATLKKLYYLLSETRTQMRFFGLLPVIEHFPMRVKTADEFLFLIQEVSMLLYYPAEHLYWLSVHTNLIFKSEELGGKLSRASCQAWSVYIIVELVKLTIKLSKSVRDGKRSSKEIKNILVGMAIQGCDLILAVNWSLQSYPLNPFFIGLFGLISSLLDLNKSLKSL